MKQNRLVVLIVLVLIASLAAWLLASREESRYQPASAGAAVPGLEEALARVDQVSIRPAGESAWTLQRGENGWQMPEADGYPADVSVLSRELRNLAAAKRVEAKTSNPAYYAKLGVQAIEDAESPTLQVSARAGDEVLAEVIIGGFGQGGNYLRLSQEDQSWLSDTRFAFPRSRADYLDRVITALPRSRFFSIEVAPAKGRAYRLSRTSAEQQDFDLSPSSGERELNYANINRLGAALSNLRLNAVESAHDEEDLSLWNRATFRSFDGLVVTVWSQPNDGGDGKIRLQASYVAPPETAPADADSAPAETADAEPEDPAKIAERVQAEVEAINARTKAWAYQVSSYSSAALGFAYEQLLKQADE